MSQAQNETPYKACQTLQRGLELIQCFNGMDATACRISELSKQTGIHRTTVKRLLETLRLSGFVQYDPVTGLYSLTHQVKSLSCGYRDTIEIVELGFPILKEISKKIAWPCSILLFDKDEMVVRNSTRAYSHLSFHSSLPGRRMPILCTAAGQAYFSHMTKPEQELVLQLLIDRNDEYSNLARDHQYIEELVKQTRKRGYGLNNGQWKAEPKFGAIAVPIMKNQKVISCINCIYLISAVKKLNNLQDLIIEMQKGKYQIEQLLNV